MSGVRCGVRRISKSFSYRAFATVKPTSVFAPLDTFSERHIGPDAHEASAMLAKLGFDSMEKFIAEAVPPKIRVSTATVDSIAALSESELHARAKELAGQNKPFKSYIGMGYHCAVVPPVILRNVREFLFHSVLPLKEFSGHGEPRVVYPIHTLPAGGCSR
jgi:glycine dehydrogenase